MKTDINMSLIYTRITHQMEPLIKRSRIITATATLKRQGRQSLITTSWNFFASTKLTTFQQQQRRAAERPLTHQWWDNDSSSSLSPSLLVPNRQKRYLSTSDLTTTTTTDIASGAINNDQTDSTN